MNPQWLAMNGWQPTANPAGGAPRGGVGWFPQHHSLHLYSLQLGVSDVDILYTWAVPIIFELIKFITYQKENGFNDCWFYLK